MDQPHPPPEQCSDADPRAPTSSRDSDERAPLIELTLLEKDLRDAEAMRKMEEERKQVENKLYRQKKVEDAKRARSTKGLLAKDTRAGQIGNDNQGSSQDTDSSTESSSAPLRSSSRGRVITNTAKFRESHHNKRRHHQQGGNPKEKTTNGDR